mmetsp:Transcript_27801/g.43142  ORF Transcript_27801/g.43142 Transcript_27801/m.43142 type:complete len:170 (+) Transcript_27801:116-625(+)
MVVSIDTQTRYTMFRAQDDRQFHLALEVLIKHYDDHRNCDESNLEAGNHSWKNRMSTDTLANLRWDMTCAIEGVILKIFHSQQIQRYRNSIVEVAHVLEKRIFRLASSAKEYERRDTLLYRLKVYSRDRAENIACSSSELGHFLPQLMKTKEQARPIQRTTRGCGARAA